MQTTDIDILINKHPTQKREINESHICLFPVKRQNIAKRT